MPPHRKLPFSNKQKKEQLKAKRQSKQKVQREDETRKGSESLKKKQLAGASVLEVNQQPTKNALDDCNRYRLHFQRDTKEDIEHGKRLSRQPFTSVSKEKMEMSLNDIYPEDVKLDMPKRPPWSYSMTRAQVEQSEEKYFKKYVDNLFKVFGDSRQLSYVELNLETWRQFWRVLEMSDVILLLADIRYPMVHFCPALYNYVVNETKKDRKSTRLNSSH